jgi:hypothetical protein
MSPERHRIGGFSSGMRHWGVCGAEARSTGHAKPYSRESYACRGKHRVRSCSTEQRCRIYRLWCAVGRERDRDTDRQHVVGMCRWAQRCRLIKLILQVSVYCLLPLCARAGEEESGGCVLYVCFQSASDAGQGHGHGSRGEGTVRTDLRGATCKTTGMSWSS